MGDRPWWLRLDGKPDTKLWEWRPEPPPLTAESVRRFRLGCLIAAAVAAASLVLVLVGAGPWFIGIGVFPLMNFLLMWPNQRRQVLGLQRKPVKHGRPYVPPGQTS